MGGLGLIFNDGSSVKISKHRRYAFRVLLACMRTSNLITSRNTSILDPECMLDTIQHIIYGNRPNCASSTLIWGTAVRLLLSHELHLQVLQTLSILIQNMHGKEALFYMFSNNHINDIVRLRLDFEDEEVLGYYINMLKAISMKVILCPPPPPPPRGGHTHTHTHTHQRFNQRPIPAAAAQKVSQAGSR